MKKSLKEVLFFVLLVSLISSCSTMQPPRYAVSVDNIQKLETYETAKTKVATISQLPSFSANCRLMGPIAPSDNLSISEFITKAFNDEFKMANIYSEEGTFLFGRIIKISFSSYQGAMDGYWDIGLNLKSSNGKSIYVANKYSFESGSNAITACNATADALAPAVQDLISKTINHREFESLIRPQPAD